MGADLPLDDIILAAVVLARLLVPLVIPRLPLPGIIGSLILDAVDQSVFQLFLGTDLPGYQTYDKALDVYYLTVAYASTIGNWGGGWAFQLGRGLWYYRLVGVVLFEYTGERWMLLVFPNTFEYYFIAIEAIKVARNPFRLSRQQLTALAAGIWIFIKLPQEWWLHIAQLDVTDVVKEQLFGVPATTPWGDAIANRPIVLLLLAAAAAVLALGSRALSGLLPRRNWEPTLSARTQARHLGWPAPSTPAAPSASFGWGFVEKTLLVTLVTLIFARILPGANQNVLQVAIGTGAIIAASTLVSQLLARRGVTWGSAIIQFAAMSIANIAAVLALNLLLPFRGGEQPMVTGFFLIELLTLIVVLFDRSTSIGRAHAPQQPRTARHAT